MRSILSNSITVFTLLLCFFFNSVSCSPAHDGVGIARQGNARMIKRQSCQTTPTSTPTPSSNVIAVPSTTSSAAAQASGASGYGYGITSNNGTGSSQADGFGFEICLLKELVCLGDAAALALGFGGKADGYAGGQNADGTKGSVAQAGTDGVGIAGAEAANLCIKDACMGLAGVLALGSASASAQGGDLATTTLLIGSHTSGQAKPTQSFSTITAASAVPTKLLPALLGGVAQLVEIKSLHARALQSASAQMS